MKEHVPTVLVVDDDLDIRETVSLLLEYNGFHALEASDGNNALAVLRSGAPVDLILLDLMMPGMDGRTFRAAQLASRDLADIPVVVISGGGNAREAAKALHTDAFLVKPVGVDQLLGTVRAHVHH